MTMADLLAKQEQVNQNLSRGQQIKGKVVAILEKEIILDLGTKAEGVLAKKELSEENFQKLKVGDTLEAFVVQTEGEGGQVLLSSDKPQRIVSGRDRGDRDNRSSRPQVSNARWTKFEALKKDNKTVTGKGLEVNKGGLVVDLDGVRGFLPTSQMSVSQAANVDDLVGQDVTVSIIEVDPQNNRLILTQKSEMTEEVKENLSKLKVGQQVKGLAAAVLPLGIFVTLDGGVEGLVHVSEVSWEKTEDPATLYKVGDELETKVIAVDASTGRVNLSIRQMSEDPFSKLAEKYQADDVIKATVSKVTSQGIFFTLSEGIEGFMPSNKQDPDTKYEVGNSMNVLVDSIDTQKRRVNVTPFITSTSGLIYK